jgi:2-haloacid dehalogenase
MTKENQMTKLPKYITFDAYGTLVDFQMSKATLEILGERTKEIDTEAFLDDYHEIRWEEILKEYRPYETVIRRCFATIMRKHGLDYAEEDGDAMIHAITTWGAFPDVPPVLRILRQYCKLVIISNTEDRIIEKNIENMGVPFDDYISADQARAYKPAHEVFNYTLKKLGCDKSDILHVANGFEYDIMPAHELGWKAVWINREGIPGDPAYGPYDELPTLTGLPELLGIKSCEVCYFASDEAKNWSKQQAESP